MERKKNKNKMVHSGYANILKQTWHSLQRCENWFATGTGIFALQICPCVLVNELGSKVS